MSAGARVALLAALLALLGVVAAGHAVAGLTTHQQVTDGGASDANMTYVVDLETDGNATWNVSTTFNLSTEPEREAFRSLAESFENGETSDLGLPAFRRASQLASEATGREMDIEVEERRASPPTVVENGTGRLTVEFTWQNFARTDGTRLRVGDVFKTGRSGATWMPGLDAGETFVIRAPPGYGVADSNVAPKIRNNRSTLRWNGPASLNASVLTAEFTGNAGPSPTATETPPPTDRQISIPWTLLATAGLGVGVVAVYLLARRRDGLDLPAATQGDETDGDPSTVGSEPTGTDNGEQAAAATEPDPVDEELLSDEERVERLLERNGGRMKQANIVKETGWSNAKVSQLLSSMEDDGRIDKLRIGRENLISFPDEDVTDIED